MTRQRNDRNGYAMLIVLIFLMLMLTFFGISQRYLGEAVRIEEARMRTRDRDEGSVHAMAAALDLLETGLPPSDPYTCATDMETAAGTRSFTVTYSSLSGRRWAIQVVPTLPTDSPPPMPSTFP
jgi:hypothetical protein